jgi:hypothetical protein
LSGYRLHKMSYPQKQYPLHENYLFQVSRTALLSKIVDNMTYKISISIK